VGQQAALLTAWAALPLQEELQALRPQHQHHKQQQGLGQRRRAPRQQQQQQQLQQRQVVVVLAGCSSLRLHGSQ
jgi:hypothetical protein